MTARALDLDLAGERVRLDAERALIWPGRRTGFIADPHFGKGAAFRRAGVGVPAGTSADDLARLGAVVDRHGLERVVVLGDFFHGTPLAGEPFLARFRDWRASRRELTLTVVRGNHDRRAGDPLPELIDWVGDELTEPPFRLRHEPAPAAGGHVLAGHVHPVVRLRGPGGDRLRLPVFWLRRALTVLPAFGGFTGGFAIDAASAERLFAVAPGGVVAIPAGGADAAL